MRTISRLHLNEYREILSEMKKKMKRKWMRDIRWPWRVKTLDRLHDPKGKRIFANDDRYASSTSIYNDTIKLGREL